MKKLLIALVIFSSCVIANENSVTNNRHMNKQQEQNYIQFLEYIKTLNTRSVLVRPPEDDCDENGSSNGRYGEEEGTGGHCRP